VQEHPVRGGTLKIYTPAKTVADCFKFRNKIGMVVALEALRESRRLKKASMGRALGSRQGLSRSERHASLSGVTLIA
jgi:hypothetical protein